MYANRQPRLLFADPLAFRTLKGGRRSREPIGYPRPVVKAALLDATKRDFVICARPVLVHRDCCNQVVLNTCRNSMLHDYGPPHIKLPLGGALSNVAEGVAKIHPVQVLPAIQCFHKRPSLKRALWLIQLRCKDLPILLAQSWPVGSTHHLIIVVRRHEVVFGAHIISPGKPCVIRAGHVC